MNFWRIHLRLPTCKIPNFGPCSSEVQEHKRALDLESFPLPYVRRDRSLLFDVSSSFTTLLTYAVVLVSGVTSGVTSDLDIGWVLVSLFFQHKKTKLEVCRWSSHVWNHCADVQP